MRGILSAILILLLSQWAVARQDREERIRWDGEPTGRWTAQLQPGVDPYVVADELGLSFMGFIAEPSWGLALFDQRGPVARGALPMGLNDVQRLPAGLIWLQSEQWLSRESRAQPTSEPHFPRQWHWWNDGQRGGVTGVDANIVPVWQQGITGRGVVIAVVDSGFDVAHPELWPNFRADLSLDVFASSLSVPSSPQRPSTSEENHGTPVAAISVGALNGIDGVGAAFNAQWAGRRFLTANSTTDAMEAAALGWRSPQIDISNNSWGPSQIYRGMRASSRSALENSVRDGRNGRGTIFVFAGGNGRREQENSNFNAYTNSIHTIAVAAMGQDGRHADYSEPGANLLIAAPSRGGGAGILTADVRGVQGYSARDYVENFGGTSAAAPIVSGVIALMLEARPELGWRDVQHILARTAVRTDYDHPGWAVNGAGHHFSHDYGFGRIDALAAVEMARTWPLVAPAQQFITGRQTVNTTLPLNTSVRRTLTVSHNLRLEHVLVRVEANYAEWGDLEINLISPLGTVSRLATAHANLNAGAVSYWTYMTVAHWDEPAQGNWQLEVVNRGGRASGNWLAWQMTVIGTANTGPANPANQAPDTEVLPWYGESIEIRPLAGLQHPTGRSFRVISAHRPSLGQLTEGTNGTFIYTMPADARGRDTFGFTLSDDQGGSVRRYFQVVNPRPAANFLAAPVRSGQSLAVDPLINDFDPMRGGLQLVHFSQPLRGSVVQEGAMLRYTPRPGFAGWDRFSYTIRNDFGLEDTGFVRIDVLDHPDFIIRFDGVDDHIEFPAGNLFNLSAPLRIEASFFATGYGEFDTGFGRIMDKDKVLLFLVGYEHAFYNDESLNFFLRLSDGNQVAANTPRGSIQLNRWHHVIAEYVPERTWDPIRVWIDGALVALTFPPQVGALPRNRQAIAGNSTDSLFLGESALRDRAFMGYIDYVRVSVGNASSNPVFNPWLHVNFVEGQGNSIGASGTAGRNGILRGGLWNSRVSPEDIAAGKLPDALIFDNGWWLDATFGYVYADAWPWLFWRGRGWQYTQPVDDGYWFYNPTRSPNWRFTHPDIWPIHWGEEVWFID